MSNLDPTAFCWYRSDTQLGWMYVGVETTEAEQVNLQGPHCVFQQAALLSNSEVMIQAIELWQEIDLDLVPCEAPDNASLHLSLQLTAGAGANSDSGADAISTALEESTQSQVATSESSTQTNSNVTNNQQRIVMVFDCATLVQLKPLSLELQSVLSVKSSSIELRVQLDQFSIPSDEMAMIENGAVVVIPAAYQSEWVIAAISATPEVPLKFGGTVEQGDQALQLQIAHQEASRSDNQVGSGETLDDSVTVWCKQLCSIPVKELLGLDTSDQTTNLHSLDARELKLVQGESTIAHGSLLSYGRGSVVAVSERLMV